MAEFQVDNTVVRAFTWFGFLLWVKTFLPDVEPWFLLRKILYLNHKFRVLSELC
jgi:asparagine N-glycosylation enzyme membrane subunit Stt3